MKKMIIVIVSSIFVVILVSYLFDRCSHDIVEDLYDDEVQSETTYEEITTKDTRRSYPVEENIAGYARLGDNSDYEKGIRYIEKFGQETYEKYLFDPKPVIYEMCKKNGDWSIYPISDDVYKKFNEKDGLLGDIEFDSIELVNWRPIEEYIYSIDTDKALEPAEVIVTYGKMKTKYYISFNTLQLIDIIKVYTYYDSFITDENGNELEVGGPVTDIDVLELVVDKYDTKVGLSKKFKDEHPNFNGLIDIKKEINNENEVDENDYSITIDWRNSSFKSGIAIFEIHFRSERITHNYRVDFKLDERGFLDEAKVTLLK